MMTRAVATITAAAAPWSTSWIVASCAAPAKMIGEVSSLILDDNGKITEAVLDVGGFLGIGEHSVALGVDRLNIQRADETGELRVYVNATEDELESMPEYEKEG